MLAAVVYLTLGVLLARTSDRYRYKLYFVLVALLVTILVGLSRIYLGVHYPTDVLAGWSIGLIWALTCWLVAYFLQKRGAIEQPREAD
jgi:undecaprenyl-diphosphatase